MLRGKGYTNNRFKKKDNVSDVMVSLKNDTEADIGELFFSRQAEKLSFKKGVGVFVRYEEITPTPIPSTLSLTETIWANGFVVVGTISENIVLPENTTINYTGPLSMGLGYSLTVPSGTILNIL